MPDSARPKLDGKHTPEDVAALFAISLRSVYHLIEAGKLKATKVRGQWWIAPGEIERFRRRSERAS